MTPDTKAEWSVTILLGTGVTSCLVAFGLAMATLAQAGHFTFEAHEVRVIDGDTWSAQGQSYRLWGVDAPEQNAPSADALRNVFDILSTVECSIEDTDRYSRLVVRCDALTERLLNRGALCEWVRYSGGVYERQDTCEAIGRR